MEVQFGFTFVTPCHRRETNKTLLDVTGAHKESSLADKYFLGEKSQIFARYKLKVAYVNRPERVDPNGFGEMVARNRGVNVRVFTNVEDAEEWLLKE